MISMTWHEFSDLVLMTHSKTGLEPRIF